MKAQQQLRALLDQLNTVIVGKSAQVRDCVACLLAGGHLLIEDIPGVGPRKRPVYVTAHDLARIRHWEVEGFTEAIVAVARRFDPAFDAATVEARPSRAGAA